MTENSGEGLEFKIAGMIVASENTERAEANAERLAALFGFSRVSDDNFAVVDNIIKFAKAKQYGRAGSFIVETDFLERAVDYLKERGIEFIDESARYDANGELSMIYLDFLIGGFAIRLEQKIK